MQHIPLVILLLLAGQPAEPATAAPACSFDQIRESDRCRPSRFEDAVLSSLDRCQEGDRRSCEDLLRLPRPPWATQERDRATQKASRACAAGLASGCMVLGVLQRRYGGQVGTGDGFASACATGEALGCSMQKIVAGGAGKARGLAALRKERAGACTAGDEARCTSVAILLLEEESAGDRAGLEKQLRVECTRGKLASCDALRDPRSRLRRLLADTTPNEDVARCLERPARKVCGKAARAARQTAQESPAGAHTAELLGQIACELGDAELCEDSAQRLQLTLGSPAQTDWNKLFRVLELLERGCKDQHPDSCVSLAVFLTSLWGRTNAFFGPSTPKGTTAMTRAARPRGVAMLETWCKKDQVRACEALYRMRNRGALEDAERVEVSQLGLRACTLGSAPACQELTSTLGDYLLGMDGVPQQRARQQLLQTARQLYALTCERDGDGCVELGDLNASPRWGQVDEARGRAAYQRGCSARPDGLACRRLALLDARDAVARATAAERPAALAEACQRGHADSCVRAAAAPGILPRPADGKATAQARAVLAQYAAACTLHNRAGCLGVQQLQRRFDGLGEVDVGDGLDFLGDGGRQWPALDPFSRGDLTQLCAEGVAVACAAPCSDRPPSMWLAVERTRCLEHCRSGAGPCVFDEEMQEIACAQGDGWACSALAAAHLGLHQWRALEVKTRDPAHGLELLDRGCALQVETCSAHDPEQTPTTISDETRAALVRVYQSGCERGDAESCRLVGSRLVASGRTGFARAVQALRRACVLDGKQCSYTRDMLAALCKDGETTACKDKAD